MMDQMGIVTGSLDSDSMGLWRADFVQGKPELMKLVPRMFIVWGYWT
jgi:hypothetical protein